MNKNIVVALSIVALLFANVPSAHAINFQDIKDFLIGPGASNTEEVENEDVRDRTSLVGAAVLASLTSAHSVAVLPTTSEGVGGIEQAQQNNSTATFTFAIESGDSLWDRIEAELETSFPDMTEDQENYTIDRIVDEVRALDSAVIEEVGITSGNPDLIYPDEAISFTVNVTGETNQDIEINLN